MAPCRRLAVPVDRTKRITSDSTLSLTLHNLENRCWHCILRSGPKPPSDGVWMNVAIRYTTRLAHFVTMLRCTQAEPSLDSVHNWSGVSFFTS